MPIIRKNSSKGFSLAELSIALTIIGVIAGSAISVAITNDFYTKKLETNNKLDRIEEAIAGFLSINGRLPCVANGTTDVTNSAFGQEGTMGSDSDGRECPNRNFTGGDLNVGVVPVETLQLPDDFMFDGWGHRITYIVDYKYANNTVTNTGCPTDVHCFLGADSTEATIRVDDQSRSARTQDAVYVLISHGENGHGAFIKDGSSTRINAFPTGNPYRSDSDAEIENAEFTNAGGNGDTNPYDSTVVLKGYIRQDDIGSGTPTREYFDDIVRYKTKGQLVRDAGVVIADSICDIASTVIDNPASNNCTGAASQAQCEVFAAEIYLRCLQ